MLYQYILFRY